MADVHTLQRRFAIAAGDHRRRSPFNARLLAGIAERPHVVELLRAAPEEQQLPVLLLASVHSVVLGEPGIELAAWYPTVSDEPRTDDPLPAFERLCRERSDELRHIIAARVTQTNEVGRCALYVPSLAGLAPERPLALVDVGTSAGLNLRLAHFGYDYDGRTVGGASPVVLPCSTRGTVPVPSSLPSIGTRLGLDRDPIDLDDPERVRWLMACVWPDQHDRFERLRAAIDIARADPVEVLVGDAVGLVSDALGRVPTDELPVVITSWVLNYLTRDERQRFVDVLDAVGGERELAWLALESPGMCAGLPFPDEVAGSFLTHLLLARWQQGRRSVEHLAECHPHGYWMHWAR